MTFVHRLKKNQLNNRPLAGTLTVTDELWHAATRDADKLLYYQHVSLVYTEPLFTLTVSPLSKANFYVSCMQV